MEGKKNTESHRKYTLFDKTVWDTFIKPGEIVEVRLPKVNGKSVAWSGWTKGTVSGYFDDHEEFGQQVKMANVSNHDGIYFTLQVIDPRLIGRAFNRLKPSQLTTSDLNVIAYRWLPIDIDPVRPAGISSSDSELSETIKLRDEIAKHAMSDLNFPAPIKAVSGNGGHLLFRLPDLPVSEKSKLFIKNILTGLAMKFNTPQVTIDTTVFNPSRIWKLYGTTTKKGDAVKAGPKREARPHRKAFIDDLGDAANG